MTKAERIFTTKEEIVRIANEGLYGGFINTAGAWCMASTPKQFKEMLERFFGFEVIECKETKYSTAIAVTRCGLKIAYNGHVSKN